MCFSIIINSLKHTFHIGLLAHRHIAISHWHIVTSANCLFSLAHCHIGTLAHYSFHHPYLFTCPSSLFLKSFSSFPPLFVHSTSAIAAILGKIMYSTLEG